MDLAALFSSECSPVENLVAIRAHTLDIFPYAIAALASFAFLELAGRLVERRDGTRRLWWLVGGAIVMGGGIWSAHFVTMSSHMEPVTGTYDPIAAGIAAIPAMLATGLALRVLVHPAAMIPRALVAGTVMGLGIGATYYGAVAALRPGVLIRYDLLLLCASFVAPVALTIAAFLVRFRPNHSGSQRATAIQHFASPLLLAVAIGGVHLFLMNAMCITDGDLHAPPGIPSGAFATIVIGVAIFALTAGIGTLVFEHLQQSAASFRVLFEKNPDAMWVHHRDTLRIFEANEAARNAYGYTTAEFRKLTIFDLLPAEDRPRLKQFVTTIVDDDGVAHDRGVWRHVMKDGSITENKITSASIGFRRQRARLVVAKDITRQRRAEVQLAQAEASLRQSQKLEALGKLTGGIAHDFNNILAIIMAKLEVLADELSPDSPHQRKITTAITAAERGADVVSRLMMVARQRPLEPTEMAIDVLLHDLARLLSSVVPSHIRFRLDVDEGLPRCRLDRSGFETAILNLAVNARDAMPEGGELHVAASRRVLTPADVEPRPHLRAGAWIEIAVRDTGAGMTPDVQAHIFEPFFTTKDEGQGTGLGLAMVYGFVHQSGGFMSVDSAVGRGTTFLLYLPVIETALRN
ncbi:ATP-binding protein [Reyranella sp. CPCC 100927]|uniref:ATP-binding protein n=1 Tax=Reyranella sp. CPCC 100927 TaxID=2599616 RepID=UPI0011B5EE1B|nr:ATP-binding protein [Reyranella sp. CPCC 100927]TWS95114.1 PAS domain S-box protein [Reyranella sp. CPCC 100927]